MKPYLVAGVDPGKKGSACIIEVTNWIRLLEVIYFGGKNKDHWQTQLFNLLTSHKPDIVGLEHVHSKKGQGVKSTFTFGTGRGGCEAAIKIAGHRIHWVEQNGWPRTVGLRGSSDPKERKAEQNAKALELFPNLAGVKGDIFASTLIATAVAIEQCPQFKAAYMAKYNPQVVATTIEQLNYQQRLWYMLKREELMSRPITFEDLR